MLAKIEFHELRCEKAWERSQKTKETTTRKQVKTPGVVGAGEDVRVEPGTERNEASLRAEERDGNPAFLKSIEWAIDRQCKLLGLDAAQQHEREAITPIQLVEVRIPSGDGTAVADATGAPGDASLPQ
jgi:hypothetical protein